MNVPESRCKSNILDSMFSEMRGVFADLDELKKRMVGAGESEMASVIEALVRGLQERVDRNCAKVKTEVKGMRDELRNQLDAIRNRALGQEETRRSDVSKLCLSLKRTLPANSDDRPLKRICQKVPQMPEDVIPLVLKHLSVPDIRNSRLVCRSWQRAVGMQADRLLEACCEEMGLLPPEGTNTVLGRAAAVIRTCIASIREEASSEEVTRLVTRLYRRYYFTWARFVCKSYHRRSVKWCCEDPTNFEWVSLGNCKSFLNHYLNLCVGMQRHVLRDLVFVDVPEPDSIVSTLPFGEDDEDEDDEFILLEWQVGEKRIDIDMDLEDFYIQKQIMFVVAISFL